MAPAAVGVEQQDNLQLEGDPVENDLCKLGSELSQSRRRFDPLELLTESGENSTRCGKEKHGKA